MFVRNSGQISLEKTDRSTGHSSDGVRNSINSVTYVADFSGLIHVIYFKGFNVPRSAPEKH